MNGRIYKVNNVMIDKIIFRIEIYIFSNKVMNFGDYANNSKRDEHKC
jgi:hypothetical protein